MIFIFYFLIWPLFFSTHNFFWSLFTILLYILLYQRFHDEEHSNLLSAMWLTAITFLCVGYGDIVPNTYCGRGITLTCGMVVSKIQNFFFRKNSKSSLHAYHKCFVQSNSPKNVLSKQEKLCF